MNSGSRVQNTSRNIITGLTNKVVLLILSFASRKVFIQFIGVEYLGINSLFANVLTILSLADMGFGIAMSYSYYKPLAENDRVKLASLVQFYKRIYNIIASVVALAGICILPFLKYIINTDKQIDHIYIYYIIALTNTVISYLFVYKSNIISADQKSYLINKLQLWVNIGKIIVQMGCVIFFRNYMAYAIIDVLATLLNNILISNTANKLYPFINQKNNISLDKKNQKDIFLNMKSVFLYKFSASIMSGTDSIIMSTIVGTTFVGMYSNYLTLTSQIISFVQIVFSSFTASIGNLVIENESKKNYEVFRIMQMISHIMSGIVSVGLLVLANDFVELWLGAEYSMGKTMAFAIATNTYFTIAMQPIWSYREATGLYNKTKYVMVATAIVNIILSVIMGMYLGAPGIVFATVLARLSTYFWYEPYLVYKLYFKQKAVGYYLDFVISIILIFLSYIVTEKAFSFFKINGWFGWIIHAVLTCCFTGAFYFLRYAWTDEFKMCINKMKN